VATTISPTRRTAWLLCVVLFVAGVRAAADELVVMTSGAFTAAYLSLADSFTASTGHRLVTATTTMGVGRESIPNRLAAGEPADIVIVAADALEPLIADGRILPGSRVDLARSRIAMAVRRGATRPDIGTVEALKQVLLNARSIAVSASVSGDYLTGELFPRLGIADALRGKIQRIERERVGEVIARGDAEIGFQQVSELRPIRGIDIVGPLPADVQRVTVFSAGIAARSAHVESARAFLAFLTSPAARPAIEASGLEPMDR
jgi:molybdate transport system substrate-binding protein